MPPIRRQTLISLSVNFRFGMTLALVTTTSLARKEWLKK